MIKKSVSDYDSQCTMHTHTFILIHIHQNIQYVHTAHMFVPIALLPSADFATKAPLSSRKSHIWRTSPLTFFFFFLSTCVTNDEKDIDFTLEDLRFPCPNRAPNSPPSPPADYFLNNWALLKHCLCSLASKGDTSMCGFFVQNLF
jgi:hypothetical protein